MRHELTPLERRLRILRRLEGGERLSSRCIARLTGLTRQGTQYMMAGLSLNYPIAQDEEWRWYWLRMDEE